MRLLDCIRAGLTVLVFAVPATAGAQQSVQAPLQDATFTIFVRAITVGTEQITASRSATGWTVVSSGRMPGNVILRRLELKYDPDWKPLEMNLDATLKTQQQTFHTVQRGDTITTDMNIGGQMSTATAMADADFFLPSPFFAAFEGMAHRLLTATKGSTLTAFIPPQTPAAVVIGESSIDRFETPGATIDARRTHVTLTPIVLGGTPVEADIWSDQAGRLIRISVPEQALEVLREDLSSVVTRQVVISRPNDERLRIPSIGFTLSGTVSKPTTASAARLPAVILLGGAGTLDREEMIAGVPILGQLANALAEAGFVTLRYDKRGVGQSGGRPESSTLADYADDVRTAVKTLAQRSDVDPKRIVVIGHSEGGAVALLAAAQDKRIAAVGLIATSGIRGTDLVLEQQQHALGRLGLSDADKQSRVELQRRINNAVVTGKGLNQLPLQVQRQVDTLEYQSILTNDPAAIVPKVRQPMLIIQGDRDTEIAPANADKLEQLANARKGVPPAQVVRLRGINHLLLPATTGEVEEYGALRDKTITPEAPQAIAAWLQALVVK